MMLYVLQIFLVIIKILELQYRGRLRELKNFVPVKDGESDLLKAMKQIAETGKGPQIKSQVLVVVLNGNMINVSNCY